MHGVTFDPVHQKGAGPLVFILKMQWAPFVQRIPARARADSVRGGDRLSCLGQKLLGAIPE
jgi:hypothetical protein